MNTVKANLHKEFMEADTLWEIHRLALIDLRKAERSPLCKIDMSEWYVKRKKTCSVCMAGSIMRFRMPNNNLKYVYPHDFGRSCDKKLSAINYLRTGDISTAALFIYGDNSPEYNIAKQIKENLPRTCSYKLKSKKWWGQQWKMNRIMKKANI